MVQNVYYSIAMFELEMKSSCNNSTDYNDHNDRDEKKENEERIFDFVYENSVSLKVLYQKNFIKEEIEDCITGEVLLKCVSEF